MELTTARLQNLLPSAKKLLKAPFWVKLCSLSALLLCCWGATSVSYINRYNALKTLTGDVSALASRAEALEKQKLLLKKMEDQAQSSSKDYIKQNVESLSLLQGEKVRVTALAKQFPENRFLTERLQFLQSDQNQIRFDELRDGRELKLSFSHRVQMDLDDLKNFLAAIEGDSALDKPFLVMKKFDLIKCYEKGDEKVYSIHAEIIQKL